MSVMDYVVDLVMQPRWASKGPRWIAFPLFVVWVLVLIFPFIIIVFPLMLWDLFSEARS